MIRELAPPPKSQSNRNICHGGIFRSTFTLSRWPQFLGILLRGSIAVARYFRNLPTEMQDNKILKSLDSKSHKSNSRLSVLRPDTINGWTRDLKPSDDDAPFAHEPAGLGILRDVRCVMVPQSTT